MLKSTEPAYLLSQVTTATVTSAEEDRTRAAQESARVAAFPALGLASASRPQRGGDPSAAVAAPGGPAAEQAQRPQAAFSPDDSEPALGARSFFLP